MKEYAERLYKSKQWQNTRAAYASSKRGLCERCLAKGIYSPGEIVHHWIYISQKNINDPAITLNWDNLELVCRNCHAAEHEQRKRRYRFDEAGKVIIK